MSADSENLARQIARDLRKLRAGDGPVRELAASKIDSLARGLAKTFSLSRAGRYSYDDLERAVGNEIAQWPSLKSEHPDSEQAKASAAQERKKNPTQADIAELGAAQKLELANRKENESREAKAAESGKAKHPGYTREQIAAMSPFQMLRMAETWRRLGIKQGDQPQAPMTRDELKHSTAEQRLYEANKVAHDATKTDKGK
jgi:hypothetical protein